MLYAANVGKRNFPATTVAGPDLKKVPLPPRRRCFVPHTCSLSSCFMHTGAARVTGQAKVVMCLPSACSGVTLCLPQAWDMTLVIRFPVGSRVRPSDVGAGVALDTYKVEVRPKPLPSPEIAATCPDSAALDEVGSCAAMYAVLRRCRTAVYTHSLPLAGRHLSLGNT